MGAVEGHHHAHRRRVNLSYAIDLSNEPVSPRHTSSAHSGEPNGALYATTPMQSSKQQTQPAFGYSKDQSIRPSNAPSEHTLERFRYEQDQQYPPTCDEASRSAGGCRVNRSAQRRARTVSSPCAVDLLLTILDRSIARGTELTEMANRATECALAGSAEQLALEFLRFIRG